MSEEAVPTRRYAYHRIVPGLVLLPSNDGTFFYVIGKYEDGPTWGLDDEPRDFSAWGWGRLSRDAYSKLVASRDEDHIITRLWDCARDNQWPRHKTMRAATEDALTSDAKGVGA